MKKLFKVLFSFLLTLVAFSCNKSVDTEFANKEQIQSYLEKVGQDHNKGLEFIFNQLASEKVKPKDFNQLVNSIETDIDIFLRTGSQDFVRANYSNAKKYSLFSIQDLRQRKAINTRVSESENLWNNSDNKSLTPKQKELLVALNDAINNESLGLSETLSVFDQIRVRAKSECSEQEVFAVLAAVEVGVNSLAYWHENLDKWSYLIAEIEGKTVNGRTTKKLDWKSVAKSDVSGAVGAAVGVGVAAVVSGPPGWAAGGAAVLAGAVGGSATDAVGQLLTDWLG
jgi:hypothetical protein